MPSQETPTEKRRRLSVESPGLPMPAPPSTTSSMLADAGSEASPESYEQKIKRLGQDLKDVWSNSQDLSQDPAERSESEDTIDKLKEAIDKGTVLSRTPVYQLFMRAHDPKSKDPEIAQSGKDYNARLTRDEKAAYRVEWVEKTYERLTKGKTYTKLYQQINEDDGEYMNFDLLVENCGFWVNPERAIERATNEAKMCLAMAGKWVRYNKFQKDVETLHLKTTVKDRLEECWSIFQEESTSRDDKDGEALLRRDRVPGGPQPGRTGCGDPKKTEGGKKGEGVVAVVASKPKKERPSVSPQEPGKKTGSGSGSGSRSG